MACRAPREVHIPLTAPIRDLEPCPAEHDTSVVLLNVYEGLVGYTPDLDLVPLLATSWENPSPTTWIFRLRPGVRFHDGTLLTAADAVYSIEHAKTSPFTLVREQLAHVASITPVDESTLQIETRTPSSQFIHNLTLVGIVPQGSAGNGIGTGPYRLRSTGPHGVLLDSFADYWAGRPKADSLHFFILGPRDTLSQFSKQQEWFIFRDASRFNEPIPRGFRFQKVMGLTVIFLAFNIQVPPFDDVRLRRAVAAAIDADAIVRERFQGNATPVCQTVPMKAFGYNPALRCTRDLARARELLKAGGIRTPLALTLQTSPKGEKTAQMIRDNLRAIGLDLRIDVVSWTQLYPQVTAKRSSFFMFGYAGFYGSAQFVLETFFSGTGAMNFFGYANPKVDAWLRQASSVLDEETQLHLLQAASAEIQNDMPVIPLYNLHDTYAVSTALEWHPRADGMILGKEIGFR